MVWPKFDERNLAGNVDDDQPSGESGDLEGDEEDQARCVVRGATPEQGDGSSITDNSTDIINHHSPEDKIEGPGGGVPGCKMHDEGGVVECDCQQGCVSSAGQDPGSGRCQQARVSFI